MCFLIIIYCVWNMLLFIFFCYEFITLKLRINWCYILKMLRKISKTYKSVTASTSLTNSSVSDVGDRAINLDVNYEETSNTYDID
jgi:hypothetical protein